MKPEWEIPVVTFTGVGESFAQEFGSIFMIPEESGITLQHIWIDDLSWDNCGDVVVCNDSLGADFQLAPAVIWRIKSKVGQHVPVIVKYLWTNIPTLDSPGTGEYIIGKNPELLPLLRRILALPE